MSSECRSVEEIINALKAEGHEIALLLVQDGVFLADRGCEHSSDVVDLNVRMFVSDHHAEERGIKSRMVGDVSLVNYDEIVDLIMEKYDRVVSV
jgi:sulfur relay protein TusB/DsrH